MRASLIVGAALVAWSAVAQALSPYVDADKAAGGSLDAATADVEKKLAGAGLDVFSQEPIAADNPLRGLENVVLTPHIAGATAEVRQRVVELAVGNVARVLRGEAPQFVLNA